jgi:thiamine biosynthesis lipoprotein
MNFELWGMSGSIHTERDEMMDVAQERLWHWTGLVDDACNRFRSDSEISRLNARPGETVEVGEVLALALDAAARSADETEGLCDPTVLASLLALGYDRDYDQLAAAGDRGMGDTTPAPGVASIAFDRERRTVTLAAGCRLDLGASAKALAVDLVADDVGVLGGVAVEIGGDVAVRGRGAQGPWVIGVSDRLITTGREPRIALVDGAVATSSTSERTWIAGARRINHIIDPRTGHWADGPYATATVSASTCVSANAFATAALLWGEQAGYHIAQAGWSARLVRHDGSIDLVGGWPEEAAA